MSERSPALTAVVQRVSLRHGLDFSGFRLPNLVEAIEARLGEDADACVRLLAAGDAALDEVVEAASNGETYFLRHPEHFEALTAELLPRLMRARRDVKRLRLWSAGCSSGEEPLSLSMVVQDALPSDWTVDILATDLSSEALRRAARASYSEWSFRNVPEAVRARHFRPEGGRFVASDRLRATVRFARHNLMDTPPGVFDLVFCRNVLIYFDRPALGRVATHLGDALASDGMLLLGPAESAPEYFPELEVERLKELSFFRRRALGLPGAGGLQAPARASSPRASAPAPRPSAPRASAPRPVASAPRASSPRASSPRASSPRASSPPPRPYGSAPGASSPRATHAAPASAHRPLFLTAPRRTPSEYAQVLLRRVHRLADRGELEGAWRLLTLLKERAPMEPQVHLTRAIVARERRVPVEAARAAEAALYLKPDLALAHVLLGDVHRSQGDLRNAALAYRNALGALAGRPDDEPVLGASGLTASQLSLLARRAVDALSRSAAR